MKKIYIFLLALLVATSAFASSSLLGVESVNPDSVDFITTNGDRIDKLTGPGQIVHTRDTEAVISTPLGMIVLSENSMLELTSVAPNLELYLVFGEASFNLDKNIIAPVIVKTPTTRTEISGKGESLFISTDDVESFYNFSERNAKTYNLITGKTSEIGLWESVDYLKNNNSRRALSKSEYRDISKTKLLKLIPSRPQLESPERELVGIEDKRVPHAPSIEGLKREVWPLESNFAIDGNKFSIKASDRELSISYPETYKMEEILSSLYSVINLDSDIPESNPIHFEYLKTLNQEQIKKLITLIESSLIENLKKNEFVSDVVSIPTELGSFVFEANEGILTITIPADSNIDLDAFIEALETSSALDFAQLENKMIRATYPETYTLQELRDIENNIALTVNAIEEPVVVVVDDTESVVKPAIKSSQSKKREFSFDLRLNTRVFSDSKNNQTIEASIMPEFTYGAFKLTLNINPFSIMKYSENNDYIDWIGYSFDLIDTLQYRSMNEVFSLIVDKNTTLKGDALNLYPGYNHLWDKAYRPLSLSMDVNLKHFAFRLFYSDLTLGRFASPTDLNSKFTVGGIDLKYIISPSYPMSISVGMLAQSNIKNTKDSQLYPEVAVYFPFYSKGYTNVGLKFAASSKLDIATNLYNPFESGFMLSASLPVEAFGFKANLGLHYTNLGSKDTNGPILHYNGIANANFIPVPADSNLLTLSANIGYENEYFGFDTTIMGDVNTNTMNFSSDNTLLETSTYLSFAGVTLRAGFSMQDFTNGPKYKENAKIYGGLDLDIGGVSTYLRLGIESIENKNYFLSYGATASFMGKNEDRADNPVDIPFSFEITTGYVYGFEDKSSKFIINPSMTIGNEDYAISLRAPIQLFFDTEGNFGLGGWGGRKWWNFGLSEKDNDRRLLYAISDSLQLINFIKIASPDDSIAYIAANRDYLRNDTLFTAFGSDNALSLLTGFNFHNLSLELYGGNIENPHIGDFKIGIYPIDLDSFSIDISVSSEFYIKNNKNFNLFFYPEIKFNVPMFWNHFNIALYTVGSISTEYVDGLPTNTKVIFDFANKKFYSAMAGIEMGLEWPVFAMKLQGGWRSGALTPDMYNIFTSTYNLTPSLSEENAASSFFAKATMEINLDPFKLELAYSAKDVVALVKDYKNVDDIFSLKTRINFNKSISMYGSFHRRGFASLFQSGTDFKQDVVKSADSIYSIGMDFDYGIVSINAELSTSPFSNGYTESQFINVNPRYTRNDTSSSFSVSTRIKF